MKNYLFIAAGLISTLIFFVFIGSAFAGREEYSQLYTEDLAVGTTKQLLAGVANTTYRVQGFELSTDVQGIYTLRCGASNNIGKWSLSNNGGLLVEYINVNKRCAAAEALTLVKPSNANTFVYLWYDRR